MSLYKLIKQFINKHEVFLLKIFKCKTFSLLKKANTLKRSEKMKSKVFVEYLVKYDFTNIFKIWNFEKDDVSDYRDVIFNENEFCDTYVITDLLDEQKRKTYVTYQDHSLLMMNVMTRNIEFKYQFENMYWSTKHQ
jgi:hypothetical protein